MPGKEDAKPGKEPDDDGRFADAVGVLCVAEGGEDQDADGDQCQGEGEGGFEDTRFKEAWFGQGGQAGGFEEFALHGGSSGVLDVCYSYQVTNGFRCAMFQVW